MGVNDIEETDKGNHQVLAKLIKKNCLLYHPSETLPATPYFLETKSQSTEILSSTLKASKNDAKDFSDRAAKLVIKYKYYEEEYNMIKASFLKESLDINKALETVRNMPNSSTLACIRLVKSHSVKGPISLKLSINGKENTMEEGDSIDIVVSVNDVIPVEFLLDDGDSLTLIENEKINIQKIIKEIAYMGAALNPELKGELRKKGVDYEVKVDIRVKLSVRDRQAILSKKNNEVEAQLHESSENVAIYNSLIENLKIYFNQEQDEFESLVRKRKESRSGCCEKCVVI